MSNNSRHNKIFTQDDISRYVRGEMSAREMHEIEKASLDDPFLADAIEGFELALSKQTNEQVSADQQDLQQRLADRLAKDKKQVAPVIRFRWWQAAAAAAVIATAGILNYNNSDKTNQETVVSEVREKDTEPKAPGNSATGDSLASTAPTVESSEQGAEIKEDARSNSDSGIAADQAKPNRVSPAIPSDKPAAATEKATAPLTRDDLSEKDPSGILSDPKKGDLALSESPKAMNRTMVKKVPTNLEKLANEKVTAEKIAEEQAKAKKENQKLHSAKNQDEALAERRVEEVQIVSSGQAIKDTGAEIKVLQGKVAGISTRDPNAINNAAPPGTKYYFQGQVFSADKMPLSNASLMVPRQNKSYLTDNNGYFTIPSNDSIINFNITAIGKQAKSFTLENSHGFGQVVLPDSENQLSEVVVVGYGSDRKKSANVSKGLLEPRYYNAAPANGWPALQDYFTKNINPALAGTPHQATDISFRVSKDGTLSSFKVTRSISAEHDKEAIRLLKAGPTWKLLSGKKADVTVTIIF